MLTACSSSAAPSQESSGQTTSPSSQQDSVSVSNAVLESESTESEQSANNTLIVYFSRWGNTEYLSDVDAITSASIVVDNNSRYGTTEYVANMIAENVGGDLHRIETVTPYTADFDELRDVNHDEMSRNYLPELKESNLDISAYDTVFIGYPVWATDVPQAVLSFLKEYDLSGKTVIPFCTHDGYGAGNSYQTIAEASHAAVLLEGIAIEAKDVPNAQDTVSSWLADIGISKSEVQTGTPIKITVGEVRLDGILYDTELAEEIKTYFPLTISMVGYGGREYYGGVEFYAQYFVGQSYLSMLTTERVGIANVTFEPGCRNNWHIHHKGGQILLCTAGRGYYQEWGKPAQEMNPGDVINIAPEVKHWHGAAPDSWFSHLAVDVPAEGSSNEWLEPVKEEEYSKLK